ncbi:MAG: WD40 repeat domain-containing protein [Proteobacteria bacterium]|nr:WD40 repeat domain-containing protein [Pseudomonadota bacterium]MBU1611302.1 WD40 repeat domain-containing protein [Pseudomonadota bacterium]
MQDTSGWSWDPGKSVVCDTTKISGEVQWLEELFASPDGEKAGCVACTDDAEFGVYVNDEFWENRYEKAITPKFTPDGRLVVTVSADMEWTLAVDGESWPEGYGFVWDHKFAAGKIACAVQQDMQYGMSVDGEIWETLYENANNFVLSPDGSSTACAVQVQRTAAADIGAFKSGVFSIAVDGKAWSEVFMNCYTPCFNADSSSVACQVRRTLSDYSIAVDGKVWDNNFQCVWEPLFHPITGEVFAPVRLGGKWGMAKDGQVIWDAKWTQLWQPQFNADGSNLFAICATDFGKFTVIKNKAPWSATFPVVRDLVMSPDGQRAAVVVKTGKETYGVVVDGKLVGGDYDMLFAPVFSPDSNNVAIRGRKGADWVVVMNGKPYTEGFDRCFDPVFSPDSSMVLIKGATHGKVERIVAPLNQF